MNTLSALFLIGCLIGTVLSTSTCYLNPFGVDISDCSLNQKCQTIAYCLSTFANETQLTISLDSGEYNYNCGIVVDNSQLISLSLEGPVQWPNSVTFNCDARQRHLAFTNSPALSVDINNIIFANGLADNGGCIFTQNIKSLLVRDGYFNNCTASQYGGAVYSNASSTLLQDSSFFYNQASFGGGALYLNAIVNGSSVSTCTISGNYAEMGGGVFIVGDYLSFTQSTVSNNSANYGAGLYIFSDTPTNTGVFNFLGTQVSGNNATMVGGGVYAANLNHPFNLFGASLLSNTASGSESDVGCGDLKSVFCNGCKVDSCSAHCPPSSGQSCSSNSTISVCYGNQKFTSCSNPSTCACTKPPMSTKGKIMISLICVCLVIGVVLITVDVIRYLIHKRRNASSSSYSPL